MAAAREAEAREAPAEAADVAEAPAEAAEGAEAADGAEACEPTSVSMTCAHASSDGSRQLPPMHALRKHSAKMRNIARGEGVVFLVRERQYGNKSLRNMMLTAHRPRPPMCNKSSAGACW